MQLTAVVAPGLRHPSHVCPLLLAFLRDSCSLAHGSSKWLVVSWGKGRGGWGLGNSTCFTVLCAKATVLISLLCSHKSRKLFFQPEIGISVVPGAGVLERNQLRQEL